MTVLLLRLHVFTFPASIFQGQRIKTGLFFFSPCVYTSILLCFLITSKVKNQRSWTLRLVSSWQCLLCPITIPLSFEYLNVAFWSFHLVTFQPLLLSWFHACPSFAIRTMATVAGTSPSVCLPEKQSSLRDRCLTLSFVDSLYQDSQKHVNHTPLKEEETKGLKKR